MSDLYRPAYHFTPPAMWLNDPNGLVYYAGEYHIFYQYHPHSTVWGPMHWGHAVSKDLVNWQHLPIALHPDDHGLIFSGSAVIDWSNTAGFGKEALIAIFTYNNYTYDDKNRVEDQNIAYSTDRGRTWTKYAGNPVVSHPGNLTDFRDPKVFWHEDHWVMALAAGDRVLFYSSSDLKHWEPSGSFGGGYGSTDGVWETPDLFQLPVSGSDSRWVLTVGVGSGAYAGGSGTQYFIGNFDGKTFTSLHPKETVLWMDYGADFYAPQSWNNEPNERRIVVGWMSNWQYARETPTETWRGMFNIPRELSLANTADGPRLVQMPIKELQALRSENHHWENETVLPGENLLRNIKGDCLEIIARVEINPQAASFGFKLCVGVNEQTVIRYDIQKQELTIDRSESGAVDFHEAFASVQAVKLPPVENAIQLHIFLDRCSVEIFANGGETVVSDVIFPSSASIQLELFTKGGELKIRQLDVFQLTPAVFAS